MRLQYLITNAVRINFLNICLVSFAFAMEDQELTNRNVKELMENHLNKNPDLLSSSKGKDIFVFLGNTGAGKSTLINYLGEKRLVVDEDSHDIILENPHDNSAMAIGIGDKSETSLPKCIQVASLLFYDLPGLEDTGGTVVNLVNACFIKQIIENANSVKLVFVVGMDQIISNRGKSFATFLEKVEELIPNEKLIQNFSSLIITKCNAEMGNINLFLSKKIELTPILKFWIKRNKIGRMSRPGKNNNEINPNEREIILGIITSTDSQKIEDIKIGAIYNGKCQNSLEKIYDGEMSEIVDKIINEDFSPEMFSFFDVKDLNNKKLLLDNFCKKGSLAFEESACLNFLGPISTQIYDESCSKMTKLLESKKIFLLTQIELNFLKKQITEDEARKEQADEDRAEALLKLNNAQKSVLEEQAKNNDLVTTNIQLSEECKLYHDEIRIINRKMKAVNKDQLLEDFRIKECPLLTKQLQERKKEELLNRKIPTVVSMIGGFRLFSERMCETLGYPSPTSAPMIGVDFRSKSFNDHSIQIRLYAEQERFRSIQRSYYRSSNAAIFHICTGDTQYDPISYVVHENEDLSRENNSLKTKILLCIVPPNREGRRFDAESVANLIREIKINHFLYIRDCDDSAQHEYLDKKLCKLVVGYQEELINFDNYKEFPSMLHDIIKFLPNNYIQKMDYDKNKNVIHFVLGI